MSIIDAIILIILLTIVAILIGIVLFNWGKNNMDKIDIT